MAQDTNPMVWGAMDRFQAHFIVKHKTDSSSPSLYARTIVSTSGMFGAKQVSKVSWQGAGALTQTLNSDEQLNTLIAKCSPHDAHIFVEPTDSGVRIHGKWRASHEFGITRQEFEIYDRIAGHIKST